MRSLATGEADVRPELGSCLVILRMLGSRTMWDWFQRKSPAAVGAVWGHICKQGNALLRFLLVEAARVTVRSQPEWRNRFFHLAMRRGRKIA